MAFKQEVNVPLVVTVGVVSVVLIIVAVIGVQAWYQSEETAEFNYAAGQYPDNTLADLKTQQLANINTTRWIDRKNGIVAIPIEDAIKIMSQSQGKIPVAAAELK